MMPAHRGGLISGSQQGNATLALIWSWWVHLITGVHKCTDTAQAQACIPSSTRMLPHVANRSVNALFKLPASRTQSLRVCWWQRNNGVANKTQMKCPVGFVFLHTSADKYKSLCWWFKRFHFYELITASLSSLSLPSLPVSASDWGCGQEAFLGQAHSSRSDDFTQVWNSASHSAPLWCWHGEYQEIPLGLRWCW